MSDGVHTMARVKVFMNFVSLSRKRLWKGLSIQYVANNVIISSKSLVIVYRYVPKNCKYFLKEKVGKWK